MYLEAKVALQHLVEPKEKGEGKGTLTRNLSQETGSGCFPTPILHSERNLMSYSLQFRQKGRIWIKELLSWKKTSKPWSSLPKWRRPVITRWQCRGPNPVRRPSPALLVRPHKGKVWNPRDCHQECTECLATLRARGWNPSLNCPSETAD